MEINRRDYIASTNLHTCKVQGILDYIIAVSFRVICMIVFSSVSFLSILYSLYLTHKLIKEIHRGYLFKKIYLIILINKADYSRLRTVICFRVPFQYIA